MPMFRFCTVLLCAFSVACASTGATPRPFPRPGAARGPDPAPPPSAVGTSGAVGYAIAGTALSLRGAPYRNGGSDPSGFDCSGFIWYVFAQHGIDVPRTVTGLAHYGSGVAPTTLTAGDLLFFRTSGTAISHVGMSIGGDEFVHAPSSSGVVRVERLASSYWAARFAGAARVAR
jgi:peptidoglycan endopeptidase LytE